ncbi:complement factor H-like [Diadema antillarum]|uniref:complement factor H-like n=1 Tax=Diadema antillarum TaxID=105358 RepID=UPI003A89EFAC
MIENCPVPTIANSNHAEDRGSIAHGDYVIVECDESYTSGSDFPTPVTCHDGQLDSDVMCHEYANCTSTPTVYGGGTPSFSPSVSCYPGGSNVTIGCSGVLFGSSNAYYSHLSYWYFDDYGSPPTCEEHCVVPTLFNGNASFAPGTLVLSGEALIVSCDQGFTLNGPNSVTCRDGTWQAAIGQCLENCISPLIPNSNYEALGYEVADGEYVVVTCDNGYTSGSGSNYSTPMTCSDGVWDISVDCYANCPAPTFPPSLRITPAARTDDGYYYHNDDITVTCAPNYRHSSSSHTVTFSS